MILFSQPSLQDKENANCQMKKKHPSHPLGPNKLTAHMSWAAIKAFSSHRRDAASGPLFMVACQSD